MSSEFPLSDGPGRLRRTRSQRLLLSVSALLTVVAVVAASLAGWGAWKLRSIDRADVVLDRLLADGPANYLIVGSDTRKGGDPIDPNADDNRAPLADTIILVRIDPGATTARILSLPRDLWVTLPSTGEKGRINAAYAKGPQQLVDTLRAELDVPINHYVEVDFRGFQSVVTAIDGVPMWFDRAMRDDNSGLDVLHPGCVTLDGPSALAFARARNLRYFSKGGFVYDGTGDLGRISRQQVFLRRVIDRAKSRGLINPISLKQLVDAGTANTTIDSSLSVQDLLAIGKRFSSFDSKDLITYTLPNTPRTTDGGAQVVEVDRVAAEPILDLFREGAPSGATPDATAAPDSGGQVPDASTVPAAQVDVSVLNSSGSDGLARSVADDLVARGFVVDSFGNGAEAGHPTEVTTIVRYAPGSEPTARTIEAEVVGPVRMAEDDTLTRGAVALYLGQDFAGLRPTETSGSTTTTAPASTVGAALPEPADPVGIVPGDPPPGESCG